MCVTLLHRKFKRLSDKNFENKQTFILDKEDNIIKLLNSKEFPYLKSLILEFLYNSV